MTMIRFFCPQCGAGQEADDMEEGVFCPYCGTYIDVARYFGRPDGNMEKGNSSEGIKTYVQVNPYNQRGMEAVYASPDVMIRKSRKHEKKREKKHKKADRPNFIRRQQFPNDVQAAMGSDSDEAALCDSAFCGRGTQAPPGRSFHFRGERE